MKKIAVYGVAGGALVLMGAGILAGLMSGTARADESEPASSVAQLTTNGELAGELVDETVYVFLSADGQVKKTISSDWTKNDLGADIYTKKEGKVAAPIEMKLSYYLDGKKVSADELRGRTGHVKIRYDYTNTEKVNGIYVPYAVLSGMMLSNEKFSNVSVKNGKLMNDGTRTTIIGVALPGMRENLGVPIDLPEFFEVEADAKEFKMEMTATLATSKIFADLDVSALNSVEALSGQLNTLASSMQQLMDGSAQLRDGLGELDSKTGLLADGVFQLQNGSAQLVSGAQKLSAGALGALNGAKQLGAGIDQTIEKVGQLKAGLSELDKNSKTISANVQKLIDAIIGEFKTNPLLSDITAENFSEKVETAVKKLVAMGDAENAAKLKASAEKYGSQLVLYQGILNYVAGASKIAAAASAADLSALKNGADKLTAGLAELSSGTDTLTTGMESLDAGISNLASNIPALSAGVEKLADGSKSLADGLSMFNEQGVQRLISLYNGDVRALVQRIQNIVNTAKNADKKVKYIYKVEEI